ncbi:hypothetical protein M0R45_033177 [Rubus argutus]|uniref:F-box domain-containing protein n=1 Tax=Rubus argutus TaxID=59490 RepID=A0AAW1WLM0_RUBAR
MRGGDSTTTLKRRRSRISQSTSVEELMAPVSSEIKNISIDDLPDVVLVEILGRLPRYKFVSQCKLVSKRWCHLMSNAYFIGRFLCLQRDHKQTRTIINRSGYEFLTRISASANPLSLLFKRLKSFHRLQEEPVVVSTYNDLVLCCASMCEQRDYYICNPCTLQWVPLPPPPQVDQIVPIGFICDQPYHNCKKDDQGGHIIQLNAEYRCKVMRLIFPYGQECACKKFKVQIFSSETGEWRESNVSSPSDINFYVINYEANFIYNGMLFWGGAGCGPCGNFLIGLDPFMIDSSCGSNGDDYYECRFIELELDRPFMFECLGTYRGCLRMCDYNSATRVLSVRDLNEEEILFHGGTVKLGMENMKVYSLDKEMMPDDDPTGNLMLGFDPYDDDILYLQRGGDSDIVKCDIHTREWSKIAENRRMESCVYFPFVVPWWPTPVPRLPHQKLV